MHPAGYPTTHGYVPAPGYGNLLGGDAPIHATHFEAWFFLFWAGLLVIVLALPWAISRLVKHKDWLPLLALGAGLITSLGEPMLDLVGHLRWSTGLQGPVFTNFGKAIPLLIPPCYALFMGLEAYWVYTVIQRGITVKRFFLLAAAIGASDALMENPGLFLHAYEYYGNQPFKFGKFPFYWSFTNAAAITTIGVMFHYVWPLVKDRGWGKLAILPLGIIATTMAEFGTGFPVFLAINADMAVWLQWVIGSLTLVLAVVWFRVLALFVCDEASQVEWTFWGLFKSRFMLPHQREAYIEGITKQPLPGSIPQEERDRSAAPAGGRAQPAS